MGGMITAGIGVAIMPWKLIASTGGYIFTWLIGYSALLGPIGGILIADYFLLRKTEYDLNGLFRKDGPYWYSGGFNPAAIIALVVAVIPNVPASPRRRASWTRWPPSGVTSTPMPGSSASSSLADSLALMGMKKEAHA